MQLTNRINYLQELETRKRSPAFDEFMAQYRQINGCPVTATVRIVGGKWKPIILYMITHDVNRFGELLAIVEGISRKVLTEQLRELETDGIIYREVLREKPLKVAYGLTDKGQTLLPTLDRMCEWGLTQTPRQPDQ